MKRLFAIIAVIVIGIFAYRLISKEPVDGENGSESNTPYVTQLPHEEMFAKGDYKGAYIEITKQLKTNDIQPDANIYFMLAVSAMKVDRLDEAAQYADHIVQVYRTELQDQITALELGREFYQEFAAVEKPNKDFYIITRDLLGIGLQSGPADENAVRGMLDTLNETIEFSKEPVKGTIRYTVVSGDTLDKIAKKYQTTKEMIARINGIDNPNRIHINQTFKVVPGGKYSIVVEKGLFRLTVYRDGVYLKTYSVGIGKEGEDTPSGSTTITTRQIHPAWQPPGKPAVHYGDPEYPLGERWLGFDKTNFNHYGIHGTNEPETIGTKSSNGCVRLRNEDVVELFDLVPIGTEVTIKE